LFSRVGEGIKRLANLLMEQLRLERPPQRQLFIPNPYDRKMSEVRGRASSPNIGVIHEKGYKEPWIIAMDTPPI